MHRQSLLVIDEDQVPHSLPAAPPTVLCSSRFWNYVTSMLVEWEPKFTSDFGSRKLAQATVEHTSGRGCAQHCGMLSTIASFKLLARQLISSRDACVNRTSRNAVIHSHTCTTLVVISRKYFTNPSATRAATGKVKMDEDSLKSCLRLASDGKFTLAVHAKPGAKKAAITGTASYCHGLTDTAFKHSHILNL